MNFTRRDFLKIVGSSAALALCGRPLVDLVSAAVPATQGTIQLGMVIDLAACARKEDCYDCIEACHSIHNVPLIGNPKEEIKWIWTSPYTEVFPEQQYQYLKNKTAERPVLVLCNHCENPPCVSVCPTKATFKRKDGIVMMDYHRCIGCRYCMAACPYGARSFNWKDPRQGIREANPGYPTRTKGVVEKCNFCDERLNKGLKPACVDACKNEGLVFGNLLDPKSDVRKAMEGRIVFQRKPALGTRPKVYYVV
jgi:Fe-S-cluster-containing dehydrogenase component